MQGPSDLEARIIRLELEAAQLRRKVAEALAAAGRALQDQAHSSGGGAGGGGGSAVGVVTTPIAAASDADTPGAGVATLYTDFDGADLSGSLTGEDVFNITNKSIKLGAVIICLMILGAWFVIGVDDCDNLE